MGKKKRAPYTKRALQNIINLRDQQIEDMTKAGMIIHTTHFKSKLTLKAEIRELKAKVKNLETELEGFKK